MFKKLVKKLSLRKLPHEVQHHPSSFDHGMISWEAPEYIMYEKGTAWRTTAVLITVVAAVLGVYYGAWTFSLAIVTFAIVYYLLQLEHPHDVEIKISNIGIKVGQRKYSFGKIKNFWIIYEPPHTKTLNIKVTGEFVPEITIQLGDQDPAVIREFLIKKIPELEGKTESTIDTIIRAFRI
jgi:hypothetical protein